MAVSQTLEFEGSASEILKANGRSFHFASAFLTSAQSEHAARLYAFCRYVDDLADESSNTFIATRELDHVRSQLDGKTKATGRIADFLSLADETGLDLAIAVSLIDGVQSDLQRVAFDSQAQLLRYAYKVAGTVGLMMCSVLGVEEPEAQPFAIDLGIAMQLTNIARDIKEDAVNDRRYVPGPWVAGASPEDIRTSGDDLNLLLAQSAERLIKLAEQYYQSAFDGLGYLPFRSRFAILIAAKVYRQIGMKLRKTGFRVWDGRTVVSTAEKTAIAGSASVMFCSARRLHRRSQQHSAELHWSLTGLTGANVNQE